MLEMTPMKMMATSAIEEQESKDEEHNTTTTGHGRTNETTREKKLADEEIERKYWRSKTKRAQMRADATKTKLN